MKEKTKFSFQYTETTKNTNRQHGSHSSIQISRFSTSSPALTPPLSIFILGINWKLEDHPFYSFSWHLLCASYVRGTDNELTAPVLSLQRLHSRRNRQHSKDNTNENVFWWCREGEVLDTTCRTGDLMLTFTLGVIKGEFPKRGNV